VFGRISKRSFGSKAFKYLQGVSASNSDECAFFPFPQKAVAWGASSKQPHWITCFLTNGSPPEGTVPVRICGVQGCINGRHFKWGTQSEAQAARIFKPRTGGRNPNARVTDAQVAEWRAMDWGNGMRKVEAAQEAGITLRTLNNILTGHSHINVPSWRLTPIGRMALASNEAPSNEKDEF